MIVRADFAGSADGHVRIESAIFADLNVRADHAVRADVAAGMYVGFGIDYGCWMDAHAQFNLVYFDAGRYSSAAASEDDPRRPRELSTSWHFTLASATR